MAASLADRVLVVALAPVCAACGQPLDRVFTGPVCPSCWEAVRLFGPGSRPAQRPQRRHPAVSRARAAGPYDGTLRLIIHAFKYDRRRSLAVPLGALVARTCAPLLAGVDVCVPVPLHWRRRYQRGFNQARDLAAALGPPVIGALRRVRHTHAQASLHAAARRSNVAAAFGPTRHTPEVAGRVVVLVDDVETTGATLEACARVLKEAGAREVRAVTIARAEARAG